jgi:hypothetical protein
MLGDSAYRINLFNNELAVRLAARKDRDIDSRDAAVYLRFYNDLLISKVKHFFFKEIPKKNGNMPFNHITLQILELGKILWKEHKGPGFKGERFYLAKYCYLLDLLYAFVYDSTSDAGVFLHFSYDPERFNTICLCLTDKLDQVPRDPKENNLRRFLHQIMPVLLTVSLNAGSPARRDAAWQSLPPLGRVYQQFVHVSHTQTLQVEPLTWHLADILNTVDGHLTDSLEYEDAKAQSKGQTGAVDLISRFTADSLNLYQSIYAKDELMYEAMFSLESEFLKKWDKLIGFDAGPAEKPAGAVFFAPWDDLMAGWKKIDLKPVAAGQTGARKKEPLPFNEKMDLLRPHFLVEKDFKIENMIESLSFDQLETVLFNYAYLADINQSRHPDILVGIYSSGVFLAHMINWIRPEPDLPVSLFQAFPYIAFQPEHNGWMPGDLQSGRVVVCDESVKTGFTFSILEAHIRRVRRTMPKALEIWSLFRHRDYLPVETKSTPLIRPLFTVDDRIMHPVIPFREFEDDESLRQVHCWPQDKGGNATKGPDDFLKKPQTTSGPDRFDYTRIIADTRATLSLAYHFSQQIVQKKPDNSHPVFLFAPSACGRVLALATGYFLRRSDDNLKLRFVNSLERAKKAELAGPDNTFLVDLTRVTGFTAKHGWRMLTDRRCDDPVDIDQIMYPLVIKDFSQSDRA